MLQGIQCLAYNFNNPEEKCLRALYDRFDFKVCTRNVENRSNRMKILKAKENDTDCYIGTTFTLDELWHMQDEVGVHHHNNRS